MGARLRLLGHVLLGPVRLLLLGPVLLGRAGVLSLEPVLQGRVTLPWPGETGTAIRPGGSILRLEKAGEVLSSLLPVCLIFH